MVNAPEKIWVIGAGHGNSAGTWYSDKANVSIEYLRADIAERQLAEARAERDRLEYERDVWRSKSGMHQKAAVGRTVAEAERDRLAAEVERLREALKTILDLQHGDGNFADDALSAYAIARTAISGSGAVHPAQPGWQEQCATDSCGKPASVHFIRGDIGSYYCHDCYLKVQALPVAPQTKGE